MQRPDLISFKMALVGTVKWSNEIVGNDLNTKQTLGEQARQLYINVGMLSYNFTLYFYIFLIFRNSVPTHLKK